MAQLAGQNPWRETARDASLTRTPISIILNVNVDWIWEITAKLLWFFLRQSISGNDYFRISANYSQIVDTNMSLTFKGLLYVDGFLGTGLKVRDLSLGLTESHCSFWRYLNSLRMPGNIERDLTLTTLLLSSTSILLPSTTFGDYQHIICAILFRVLTKGKLSGSLGEAWIKNSSLQLSNVSKLLELFTS
jgi:hypothetical protein